MDAQMRYLAFWFILYGIIVLLIIFMKPKKEKKTEDPQPIEEPEHFPEELNQYIKTTMISHNIIKEDMSLCCECPLEYLNTFLEYKEEVTRQNHKRYYKIKCAHYAACQRASFYAKREVRRDADGMDGEKV